MLVIVLLLICCSIAVHAVAPSLVIAMMCRDEEVNLKTNLEKWLPYVDYFVFVVDVRTIDKSVETIKSILTRAKKQFKIVDHEFVGFGHARTVSLTEAWNNFPQATHVLIADPDWIPRLDTIGLQELEVDAEVYRFVVFDRNGASRRKMDWLIKHRAGLAMKYHLHEVLDIGTYTQIQQIGWVIDEIEKPGTWHATVGHQHSMSLKRYEFDLEMLHKDEALYTNDAHTDYYLGITSQAVADSLIKLGRDPEPYLSDALFYMHKRIDSRYTVEFVDERWAAMYLLALSYVNLKGEFEKAVHLFNLCRDFNPSSLECGIALTRIYLGQGVFDLAMNEVSTMLKQETKEREYLTHFKQNACEMPELVLTLFKQKALSSALTAHEAKYLLLMDRMLENKICATNSLLTDEVRSIVNSLLKEEHSSLGTPVSRMRSLPLTSQSSVESLCSDVGLQSYLLTTRYLIHPCESLKPQMTLNFQCTMFSFNLPPANEEMQANSEAKEFVGAAMVPDIIHYVYNGNSGRVFNAGHTFRFLFASYFNPKIVYNLIGFFERTGFTDYEIVVVADQSIVDEIKNTLQVCSALVKNRQIPIVYSHATAADYLKTAVARKRFQSAAGLNSVLFDYIEYNYGISVSSNYDAELASFKQILQPNGVIGLTYFAKNHHVDKIRRATSTKNTSALIPFCLENSRFIKSYLELNGMSFLIKDQALLWYLGAEAVPSYCPIHPEQVPASLDWRGYSQSEVLQILKKQGLRATSWMPRAYAHPFDNIEYHQIQKFAAMGMSQEHYIEEYLTFFRYTIYVQNDNPAGSSEGASSVTQKAVVTSATLADRDLAEKVLVIDRLGALSASFAGTLQRAASGLATTFAFAPYSLTGKVALSKIVLPGATACMAQMSSGLSVWQLHQLNVNFITDNGGNITSDTSLKTDLVSLLNYLEMVNAVTFLCDNCDVVVPPSNITTRSRGVTAPAAPKGAEKASVVVGSQGTSTAAAPADAKTVKIGGLQFKVNDKTGQSTSGQASAASQGTSTFTTSSGNTGSGGTTETKAEVPSVPKYTPLDPEVQMQRMKALGFSDAKIADIMAKRTTSKTASTAAGSSATASSTASQEPSTASKVQSGSIGDLSAPSKTADHASTKSAAASATTEVKSTKYPPLDVEIQIKRMKALGFSDAKIADTLAKKGIAVPASIASVAMTTQALSGSAAANIQSPPKALEDSAKISSVDGKDDTSELKKKLKGILNMLTDKDKKQPPVAANTVEKPVVPEQTVVRSESESQSVAGGLLQKRALENKAKLADTSGKTQQTATGVSSKASPVGSSGAGGAASSISDSEIVERVKLVRLPANVQSRSDLIASYRRIECFHFALDSKKLPNDCQLSGPVKRKSSMLGMVSVAKLEFDMAQFKYLQRQRLLSTRLPLDELLARYQEVLTFVNNRKETERKKLAKMALSSLPTTTTGMLNRVIQVSTRDADSEGLVHLGAVKYIQSIAETLTADFAVVDVLLKEAALVDMSRALLSSTIWFDTSNGFGFVSHHDDGLILESIRTLTQYIAYAVSTSIKPMRVVKYYTVAMSLDRPGNSSIAMANGEEMVAILWLNPSSGPSSVAVNAVEGQPPVEDGLRIFDDFAAGRLYSQGISVYPSAHSDFFSKSGDLLIDMAARCNVTNSELVPRKTNRLVLLQPKRPFYFTIPPPAAVEDSRGQNVDEFESRTMIALVAFLGKA